MSAAKFLGCQVCKGIDSQLPDPSVHVRGWSDVHEFNLRQAGQKESWKYQFSQGDRVLLDTYLMGCTTRVVLVDALHVLLEY